MYQLICNLTAPDKPSSKSFDELVKLVQTHHQPPPSITVQRFNFHSRTHKEGGSMFDFIAHLCQLSEHCAFGKLLNDKLRDRIVCRCNDTRLQHQLLAKSSPLSLEDAFSLVQAHKSAEQNTKDLQKSSVTHVHVVKPELSIKVTAIAVEGSTLNIHAVLGRRCATFARKQDTLPKFAEQG